MAATQPSEGAVEVLSLMTLSRDLKLAAATLSDDEARFLVDAYYQEQENRKRDDNQVRSLNEAGEPHQTIQFFAKQHWTLERQLKGALDIYSNAHDIGRWSRSIHGIGPVLAAGLLAHIDLEKAQTAGAIWRFAGLDPTVEWKKGQKRPWNAKLKVICWKIGDSFVKQSSHPNDIYGHMYRERKAFEVERDLNDGNAERAAKALKDRTITDPGLLKTLKSGHLPDGQLDFQARRWTVKIFLSHYHQRGREIMGLPVPKPFALEHLGHVHIIEAPPIPE